MDATKNIISSCENDKIDLAKVWELLKYEAEKMAKAEPCLSLLLNDVILSQNSFGEALSARIARKLTREDMGRNELEPILNEAFKDEEGVVLCVVNDIVAIFDRDAACHSILEPFLFFKGFLAITTYRVSHFLWENKRKSLALYFQSVCSEVFAVDIHPAANIGSGILLDHATSFVVGETAIVEDNVSILHEVTLGGTGKEEGGRHPIVRSGVLIGAGAKLLGRIEIGKCAKIGAGSVVLNDVASGTTVAGVPAVLVGKTDEVLPAMDMNQSIECGMI